MNRAYIPKSKSQVHLTPQRVYEIIWSVWGWKDMFDPCPVKRRWNALEIRWERYNYINPPYAIKEMVPFILKAIEELDNGNESIMLLPCKTDQDWFHDLILKNKYEIEWVRKRLKFTNNKNSSPAPNFLVKIGL